MKNIVYFRIYEEKIRKTGGINVTETRVRKESRSFRNDRTALEDASCNLES